MAKDDNSRESKVKAIFANYPKEDTIFMASDNRAFFTEPQADAYAQGLKDKKVEVFERVASDGVEKLMEAGGTGETSVTGENNEPEKPEVPSSEEVKEDAATEEQPAKKSSTKKK